MESLDLISKIKSVQLAKLDRDLNDLLEYCEDENVKRFIVFRGVDTPYLQVGEDVKFNS